MAALQSVEPSYKILTDATPSGINRDDVLKLIQDIEEPHKLGIRAWQMLPKYLRMRHSGAEISQWSIPDELILGERTEFLRTAGGLANVDMIYEVCRLAGSKKIVPPVDMDFMAEAGSDLIVTTAPTAICSRRGKVRIMQTLHDLFLYDNPKNEAGAQKFRLKVAACVEHADMILSMSNFTTEVFLKHHPEAEPKVRLLYQPIPADEATIALSATSHQQQTILNRFGLSPGGYIFFVGAIEARKNVANLIRAHRASSHASKIPLVIAGGVDESYMRAESLQAIANPEGIRWIEGRSQGDPGARLIGRISELEKLVLLRNASLFAFPSLVEGFGIPVLEAQSLGCPVLASSGSTMPEVLGSSAYLVDRIHDTEALSIALDEVISKPQLSQSLAEMGSKNCMRFSKRAFANRLKNLIDECRAMPSSRN